MWEDPAPSIAGGCWGCDRRWGRIGFGLPSGGGVTFADASTLKSAFDGRKDYD